MAESYEPQPVMIDESLEMLQEQMNAVEYEADGYGDEEPSEEPPFSIPSQTGQVSEALL